MKTAFLQITGHTLLLTPVKKSCRQNIYGTPSSFELPENLSAGKTLENLHALAVFTANCIQETGLAERNFVFCLDSGHVITKEYKHLPAKQSDLQKLARLEAETVLQDGADDYMIATQEYQHMEPATGRLKSILFAVPTSLVTAIKQEFRHAGIKIIKITPTISGLMSSCKTILGLVPKSPAYRNKTIAVLDVGYENLRVILFSNGEPVFQKDFDSVWEDILETLHREGTMSYEDAKREMQRSGFLLTGGTSSFGDSITSLVSTLLDTAAAEVIRNVRVVLSAERLEPDQILFCGGVASHPDFNRFVENLSLEIPFQNIEITSGRFKTAIGLEPQAGVAGYHAGDFFTLNGLLASRGTGTIDFLAQENERRGNQRFSILVMALLTLVAIGIMLIQPIVYQMAVVRQKADEAALASPQIAEIKALQEQKNKLQEELRTIENDQKLLPYQKSKMEEIVSKLQAQLVPQVDSITTCQISGETGVVTLSFTTSNFDKFNQARKSVADAGYFTIQSPFNASKINSTSSGTSAGYQCSASLKVKDFKPLTTSSSAQTSSAVSSSSAGKGGQTS